MPINATVTLEDSESRKTTKTYETEHNVLADAQGAMAALIADLEAITDLGVVSIKYTLKDDSEASAAAEGSNIDVGATFRVRLNDGYEAAMKVPGFPISKAVGGGSIPVNDEDVEAYFLNFYATGEFTTNRGNHVTQVLSGKMDK